ncbi:hypothetical protein [Xanthomonas citri]|uniref:hypothetical protein n=1 Tax=Xanthomonas citri TaxID=346 RepID=UPI003F5BAFEF
MRDGHAKFLAAGNLAGEDIGFTWDTDQVASRCACDIDHCCDPLLGVGDRGPFGFDIAHGAQRLQLIGVGSAVLINIGDGAAVLRVRFGLGQAIWGSCKCIAIDEGDFECVSKIVHLSGNFSQCYLIVIQRCLTNITFLKPIQNVCDSICIRTSRPSPMRRCFNCVG